MTLRSFELLHTFSRTLPNPHRHTETTESAMSEGCSGAGTRWNAVPANILEPERRSRKYRWPQVKR